MGKRLTPKFDSDSCNVPRKQIPGLKALLDSLQKLASNRPLMHSAKAIDYRCRQILFMNGE